MASSTIFQRIFLPGLLVQSVIVGGGYATGRELVEFFLYVGPLAGLLGMVVATLALSVVSAVSFELARVTMSYDYRTFFKHLIGRAWVLFEIAYIALGLLVLAVIGAAAGELIADHFGVAPVVGTVGLLALIGLLVFWGTTLIERVLASWSILLYATYSVFIIAYLGEHGSKLPGVLKADMLDGPWLTASLRYVGYNITVIPIVLFCVKHMNRRADAIAAGLLAGPLAMGPAIILFLGMATNYPAIVDVAVPTDYMMQQFGVTWLKMVFYIVIFGTFVETGSGFIHALNERISRAFQEIGRELPRWSRSAIAVGAIVCAVVLADRVGLIDLIGQGYGTLTYIFILIFLLPLFTVGVWRIRSGR